MVLESTMICVDNSDYMRNGDYAPTRLTAQQDAAYLLCQAKIRAHPENNVGLMTLTDNRVISQLCTEPSKIFAKLHGVQPNGTIDFSRSVSAANLALKHRQAKQHRPRIIVFVGSPVDDAEREIETVAKRLKKEKVFIDIVSFGEQEVNEGKLVKFIDIIGSTNGRLISAPPNAPLTDAMDVLLERPDGTGHIDVNMEDDPELAMALRISMEEQRALQQPQNVRDPSELTEDEQLALAMQLSLAQSQQPDENAPHAENADGSIEPMEVEEAANAQASDAGTTVVVSPYDQTSSTEGGSDPKNDDNNNDNGEAKGEMEH